MHGPPQVTLVTHSSWSVWSLWSLWGLLQFASPSASATAAINCLPTVAYQGADWKNSSTVEVLVRNRRRKQRPMHNGHHHHISPYTFTVSPSSPINSNKGASKEENKKKASIDTCKPSRLRPKSLQCCPSHHVNHSDQSLGPCRPPSLGTHTSSILDRTLRYWPHDLRCTTFSFQLRPRIWTQSKYPRVSV